MRCVRLARKNQPFASRTLTCGTTQNATEREDADARKRERRPSANAAFSQLLLSADRVVRLRSTTHTTVLEARLPLARPKRASHQLARLHPSRALAHHPGPHASNSGRAQAGTSRGTCSSRRRATLPAQSSRAFALPLHPSAARTGGRRDLDASRTRRVPGGYRGSLFGLMQDRAGARSWRARI